MSRIIWHGDKVYRKIKDKSQGITRRISEIIAEKARQIVPVKTGKLKASIKATDKGVVAATEYAAAVELGGANRAAQPYLRPSIERFNQSDLKQSIR